MMNYIYTLIPIALLIFAAVQGSKWNFNAATYMDKKYTNAVKGMMCVVIMYVHLVVVSIVGRLFPKMSSGVFIVTVFVATLILAIVVKIMSEKIMSPLLRTRKTTGRA